MISDLKSASKKKNRILKLSVIVPALMIGVTFAACMAVGIGGYVNARSGLEKAAHAELAMVGKARQALVDMRLASLFGDLTTSASGAAASLAFTDMNTSLGSLDADRPALTEYFQPAGSDIASRAELTGKDSKIMYSWRHTEVHNSFLSSWKNNKYADIYAINKDGLVIYSVTKSGDFLQSVVDGPLKDTGLGEVFSQAIGAEKGNRFHSAFQTYAPADGAASMFVAAPAYITSFAGEELAGVVVFRIGTDYLGEVASNRDGLGETGQVYIVDDSETLITKRPLAAEPTALVTKATSDVVDAALGGNLSSGVVTGTDGIARITVASPLTFDGSNWAIVAERSVTEAMASVTEMRNSMIVITLITVCIAAIIALFFSRSITRPLMALVAGLESIADGNPSTDIKAAERGDEIGDIGRAVVRIRENSLEDQRLRAEEDARTSQSQAEQRQVMLAGLASEFEASVGKVVDHVARSASGLKQSADDMRQMTVSSGEKSKRAAEVSAEAMTEVQSIATASDQLSSSIQEISSLIERSSAVAQTATDRAASTNNTVRSLAEAANRIGEVITLISDIADQTNLLALNATIEAARAGDAGRGFAVVASEVKELAAQTGKATGEIQHQIDAIRKATDDAVAAIGDIQDTIGEITESVTNVSAAVTEQSFATRGIAENTQRAATGTSKVSEDISDVSSISEQTSDAANAFVSSAEDLSEQTTHLDAEVKSFLTQVRSA